ncbi:MAG: caspase family protein [Elusimicrobia bacterium]|nr:caspase family protein [Elusimicrobiota bacterium]
MSPSRPSAWACRAASFAALAGAAALSGCFFAVLGRSTPVWEAAVKGDDQAVRELIEAGADPSPAGCTSEPYGWSCHHPLIGAAQNGHLSTVKLLLQAGATPYDVDDESKTARERAEERGYVDIARVLQQAEELGKAQEEGAAGVTPDEVARIVQAALDEAERPKVRSFSSDADAPVYRRPEDPDAAAIVLGVEDYADLPAASFARRDAVAVRDHLLALGVPKRNMVFAADREVTKTSIMKYVDAWLPKRVSERSTVYFYFSGHGAPDFRTGRAFLVPSDGDPKYLRVTGYPLGELYEKLARLRAKRVVVALDSCFSGAGGRSVLAKGTRPLVTTVDLGLTADPRLATLSASGPDQISGVIDEQGHGAFTYYLLKGLNGAAARDGAVTLRSLHEYLVPRVEDAARRENRAQTPQLVPAGGGAPLMLR